MSKESPANSLKQEDEARLEDAKRERDQVEVDGVSETLLDLRMYHELNAGSLVVDPEEAKIEFGEAVASRLKLSRDGTKVLWPQPTDDPEDPQNWSERRKIIQLVIITLAAIIPDFDSGIGIAAIFALAEQFNTTTGVINNLTSNWSIFLLGWGSIFAVILMRRYGRLPVLFWSQVIAAGFLIGATFAPNLATFAGMRCLTAFFATCPQVTGLFVVTDMFPFHKQARMLNFWTMGFLVSPFLSPFAFGFLVARANWRWSYGIGSIYSVVITLIIAFFGEETMYDRRLTDIPRRVHSGFRYRIETLIGITGARLAKYRDTLWHSFKEPLRLVWRPQLIGVLAFEAMLFGFGIGINVTNAVFLAEPIEIGGFAWGPFAIAGGYGTPIVGVLLGELFGRYVNDFIANAYIRRNHGVFDAEARLWACYVAVPLYICGFVLLGASLQNHMSPGALIMGWGIAEFAIMVNTTAVYAYANNCFPKNQGEISALLNLFRTLGGFAVAYFQVPWASKNGALQTFGCEAAIVAGLFLLVVPLTQWKGKAMRARRSLVGLSRM
ncbi:MFS general substrate transporter [Vararia minispora EC-137]|uniref:MFS general substrate transporter n=1 Tax=Vararia minispora EC-137 TaxID=1314806 RepID=A0ACB8QJP0_9AGAM|nr:MFS general substrate transporter [Vararia minispora EC-137]